MSKYEGKDNYGRPKTDYLRKIEEMDDEALGNECYDIIYQSARCSNNPRADWHWQADACCDESKRRRGNIYQGAYNRCYKDHVG